MPGYSSLALFIARFPEYSIYRKFGALSARRLLYMQAELSHLERDLQITAEYDPPNAPYASSWVELNDAADEGSLIGMQRQKMLEISEKLDKYHATLLQTRQVLSVSSPRISELGFLRYWLGWPRGGNSFLQGIESEPYSTAHADHTPDLINLSPAANKDPFAQFLSDHIVPWYHGCKGYRKKPISDPELGSPSLGPLWEYKEESFIRIGDIICAFLSSIIPVVSIFLLYYIQRMFWKLIVATMMSFFFSFVMAVVIRGRRADVFAASTAFAAVQVVFIGGVNIITKQT